MAYKKSTPEWLHFLDFLDKRGAKAAYIHIIATRKYEVLCTLEQLRTMDIVCRGVYLCNFSWAESIQGGAYWFNIFQIYDKIFNCTERLR